MDLICLSMRCWSTRIEGAVGFEKMKAAWFNFGVNEQSHSRIGY